MVIQSKHWIFYLCLTGWGSDTDAQQPFDGSPLPDRLGWWYKCPATIGWLTSAWQDGGWWYKCPATIGWLTSAWQDGVVIQMPSNPPWPNHHASPGVITRAITEIRHKPAVICYVLLIGRGHINLIYEYLLGTVNFYISIITSTQLMHYTDTIPTI
jgi:hypothetical protein